MALEGAGLKRLSRTWRAENHITQLGELVNCSMANYRRGDLLCGMADKLVVYTISNNFQKFKTRGSVYDISPGALRDSICSIPLLI